MNIKPQVSSKFFILGMVACLLTCPSLSSAEKSNIEEIDTIWIKDIRTENEMFVTEYADIKKFIEILEKNKSKIELISIPLEANTLIKIYKKILYPNSQNYISLTYEIFRIEIIENGKMKKVINDELIEFVPQLVAKYSNQPDNIKDSFWEKGLKSEDRQFQFDAARKIAEKGDQRSESILLRALENKDWQIVHDSLMSMAHLNASENIINAILDEYNNSNTHIRRQAIYTAEKFVSDDRIVDLLVKALKDNDDLVSFSAVHPLEKLKETRIIPELAKLVDDRRAYVRKNAMDVLISMRDRKLIPIFNKALKSKDAEVRWKALLGLEFLAIDNIRDKSSVPILIEALNDTENNNNSYAAGTILHVLNLKAHPCEITYENYLKWWQENKDHLILDNKTGKFQNIRR